ncbi:MAG: dNTP triphosphohydrolase [Nitrospinae bacterium]|nr:dNTP triphosphohydrolase [Nitrospinota bacterium]
MYTPVDANEYESKRLAAYAMHSRDTAGRRHPETEHPYRTAFQRDRDRVIHSSAFRRLEYKTQVFVYHEGDYYRTRLTHTIEVAQISRSAARTLCLNEDLSEAIALAHDLGHSPFGHSGEKVLDELMKDYGGFEHNRQSLRIVDHIENRYPGFRGLNLTYEVREGIAKHVTDYDDPSFEEFGKSSPTLEAQIVDYSDAIAYNSHDLDDGITSEMIDMESLKEVRIWDENYRRIKEEFSNLSQNILKYQLVRAIINQQVTDLVELFNTYLSKVELLPPNVQKDLKIEKKERLICDYIAGMTDRFAIEEYKKLFDPYERV